MPRSQREGPGQKAEGSGLRRRRGCTNFQEAKKYVFSGSLKPQIQCSGGHVTGPLERKLPPKHKNGKKPAVPAVFTKEENATLAQCIEILNWHHAQSKPGQKKTASHYSAIYPNLHIKQPLVSDCSKMKKCGRPDGTKPKNPLDKYLTLSDGWLTALKKRCGLKELKRHGEAGSAYPVTIEEERLRVQKLILYEGYDLNNVFNMDETGLFWA
ncbi:hypothetical protein DFH07DRAFT_780575 [Mycena maculata]|uniref:Uncharacterized protein n=1 Tax=Mycena maculata TaxID=230809 RepID=A0AAD7I2D5_9AGAR|nr:hypothetical protein DFH07DRAFT_780575 [Mycena maculata]